MNEKKQTSNEAHTSHLKNKCKSRQRVLPGQCKSNPRAYIIGCWKKENIFYNDTKCSLRLLCPNI